jgi:putative 4-mercaptohistidine N1-methyltranferase
VPDNPYESDQLVAEYLLFHYGGRRDLVGVEADFLPEEVFNFATRLVSELAVGCRDFGGQRALDVGCAVGGSSFALSRHFQAVLGIDYSAAFVRAACALRDSREVQTSIREEGDRTVAFTARLPEGVKTGQVEFRCGDAMALDPELADFDLVLAANLICRLPDPQVFLRRLPGLVRPDGLLFLTTPFTWLESFAPPEKWLGGHPGDAESFTILAEQLEPHFVLERACDLPFLIRETRRKFQLTWAKGSRWRRRA